MCGVAGFLDTTGTSPKEHLIETIRGMTTVLEHRGPDDQGMWVDEEVGLAFGQQRLAVVDLSPTGAQPMSSKNGRWVINFNGEIYNHRSLRRELAEGGASFRGSSDTEVLLELIAERGVEQAVVRCNGMFAIAVWDRQERELWLARDRVGEKPLYVGWCGKTFLFGSELKSLQRHPHFDAGLDQEALSAYFRLAYVPSPLSIYRGIKKLPPGSLLRVDRTQAGRLEWTAYWDAKQVALRGIHSPSTLDDSQVLQQLDAGLHRSVRTRMVADVPVGSFLSGGIDSSLTTAVMQAQSSRSVKTFTVGFTESIFDEAPFARGVAKHLGTDHTEVYVDPAAALEVIPSLPKIYDEPFADSSQIPTYLVSRLARSEVTVALSGDGGDELFAGYDRYHFHRRIGRFIYRLPRSLRLQLATLLNKMAPSAGRAVATPGESDPFRLKARLTTDRLNKLAGVLQREPLDSYARLVSVWPEPDLLLRASDGSRPLITRPEDWLQSSDLLQALLWLDLVTYLPDDLLTKVDRAAMAVSLETRLPLLDHELIEFSWSLPVRFKVRDGRTKWALKQLLSQYVPPSLFDRPKKGFSVPIADWLRGPLRRWANDLLDPHALKDQGILDVDLVRQTWDAHLDRRTDAGHRLWAVLMFQSWLVEQQAVANRAGGL